MLTLPIKKQWFDLILAGVKTEEYRESTSYYDSRFLRHENQKTTVRFRNGYRPDSPLMECEMIPRRNRIGKLEWGAVPDRLYWSLEILSVRKV